MPLNQNATTLLSGIAENNTLGPNSQAFVDALSAAGENSPYLASLLNTFADQGGTFAIGEPGGGFYTDPVTITSSDGTTAISGIINVDPNFLSVLSLPETSGNLFATGIAHELGHADLPGGVPTGSPTSVDDAIAQARTQEGVAATAEFIVSKQLGLQSTYSDLGDSSRLTNALNNVTAGTDFSGFTSLQSASNLTQPGSQAVTAAGTWYGQQLYGNSGITYDGHAVQEYIVNNAVNVPTSIGTFDTVPGYSDVTVNPSTFGGYGSNANPFNPGGLLNQGFVPQSSATPDQAAFNDFSNPNSGAFIGAGDNAFQNAQTAVTSTTSFGDSSLSNNGYVTIGAGSQALAGADAGGAAAAAGTGFGTIGDSSFVTIDAGVTLGTVPTTPTPTYSLVAGGAPDAFLVPTQIPTSIDGSYYNGADTLQTSVVQSSNTSYTGVNFSGQQISQATSVTQNAPVDTLETGTAEGGDLGALAGGLLDGVAGIFGGIVDGIAGLVSGIFGGGNTGFPGGGYSGSYGGSYGGSSGGGYPVVLDLAGKGIKITPLSSSNMFFDMANKGYAQRTAWAGAGNGVLVYDPTGGPVTQANQVNFTLWDPTAKNDMQALQHVFDTNHDGVLNASDASWSKFRILVTNADGTTTLETLAQAGVTAINLTPNAYTQAFTDGSSIGGETTFTRANGSTGTAATVTFANDGGAYILHQTVAHNGDGSTTLTNAAYNIDGTLAETVATTTSANGLNKTTVTSDGSGGTVIPLSRLYRNVKKRQLREAVSLRLAA